MTPNMCANRIDYSIKEKEIQEAVARTASVVRDKNIEVQNGRICMGGYGYIIAEIGR